MANDYKEALQRIADGEPGPQAIAEETLENGSGPGSGAAGVTPQPTERECDITIHKDDDMPELARGWQEAPTMETQPFC